MNVLLWTHTYTHILPPITLWHLGVYIWRQHWNTEQTRRNWHQWIYYVKTKNSSNKMLPLIRIEPGASDLMYNTPFWANLAFARKTQTLGFLNSHALLILTESSKSKNQVVHEETFENTLDSLCQVSPGVTFCHWIFLF